MSSPTADTRDLVVAARRRMAIDRQQLLATMVMMGINRVVVTDGKISAHIGRAS
jgi:isochorismate hydrolase